MPKGTAGKAGFNKGSGRFDVWGVGKLRIGNILLVVLLASVAWTLPAETNVVNGMSIVCEDGVCRMLPSADEKTEDSSTTLHASLSSFHAPRLAQGYMDVDDFLAFLENRPSDDYFADKGIWLVVLLALVGGLAMNLTPCVLPMIPINLMIIGKSARRGAWYGFGMTMAYGTLGVLASVGGMAFGSIQSNPWFNLFVAFVFVALALSLFGVFFIDFSKSRSRFRGGAFLMGVLAAVLAGACVAPILIAVLLLTAKLFAAGSVLALALPFVLGLGMALPWPFVGAGLAVLPKPGAWMQWVNRGFGVIVLGFAAWHGKLAYNGFEGFEMSEGLGEIVEATPATLDAHLKMLHNETSMPILVDCWATWCKNCAAMEKGPMSDPKVRKALGKFIVVRLQSEDIDELRRLPGFGGILGLPAFAIFE